MIFSDIHFKLILSVIGHYLFYSISNDLYNNFWSVFSIFVYAYRYDDYLYCVFKLYLSIQYPIAPVSVYVVEILYKVKENKTFQLM